MSAVVNEEEPLQVRSFRDDASLSSTFTADRPSQKLPLHQQQQQQQQQQSTTTRPTLHQPPVLPHYVEQDDEIDDDSTIPSVVVDPLDGVDSLRILQKSKDCPIVEEDEAQLPLPQPRRPHSISEEEAEEELSPPFVLPPVPPRTTPIVVQSDEASNEYWDSGTITEDELHERWYQPNDYKDFKNSVIQIVKAVLKAQARRQQKDPSCFSYSRSIEHAYNACFQMEMETRLLIFTKQEMSELKRLYRTVLDTECVLGLERLLVQRIGKDRSELRMSLLGILQDLQTTPGCWPNRQVLMENMFQISQEVSRPARLFARHLAQAQALASCKDNHTNAPRRTKSSEPVPTAPPGVVQPAERRLSY